MRILWHSNLLLIFQALNAVPWYNVVVNIKAAIQVEYNSLDAEHLGWLLGVQQVNTITRIVQMNTLSIL